MDRFPIASSDGPLSGIFVPAPQGCETPILLACIHGGGCNGMYFDLKGNSVLAAAHARGWAVLSVNRPGYAGNAPLRSPDPIKASAPLIRDFIQEVCADHLPQASGVALIGHSIGGAVALTIAGQTAPWTLRAVAVSGIGIVSPPQLMALELPLGQDSIDAPAALSEALFHDPERSLNWQSLTSLRHAAEPWLVAEIDEVVHRWPTDWTAVAPRITVPVHLRLAEHERIWLASRAIIDSMAASLVAAPATDAEIALGGGHLYEAYKPGPQLVRSQLDFIERCEPV